jgi:hypothetical protein
MSGLVEAGERGHRSGCSGRRADLGSLQAVCAAMRKNWLAAAWAHWFRTEPLVPDVAFQNTSEPYPGHWRRFPEPWRAIRGGQPDADARMTELSAALDAARPVRWA